MRSTGWCHSQRNPSLISARHCGRDASPDRSGRRRTVIEKTSSGGHGERAGVDDERQGEADGEEHAGERRSDELVGDELGRVQPAVRSLQVPGGHQ